MKRHNNELEIDEDVAFEHKTWTFQRVSWVVLLLIIIAALLGFTGRGGLPGINTMKEASASQNIELEYNRFLRNQVSEELKVHLKGIQSTSTAIAFSKDFYDKLRVEQVVPEPAQVQVGAKSITYTFDTPHPESHIIFYTKPMKTGMLDVTVQGPENEAVAISQYVYP